MFLAGPMYSTGDRIAHVYSDNMKLYNCVRTVPVSHYWAWGLYALIIYRLTVIFAEVFSHSDVALMTYYYIWGGDDGRVVPASG